MNIVTHFTHRQDATSEMTRHYRLSVRDTQTPIVTRLLQLPNVELTRNEGPVLAEPLRIGATGLCYERHITTASDVAMNTFRAFGLSLIGVAVLTGACMLATPWVGPAALVANGACGLGVAVAFGAVALRERMQSDAVRAAYLLQAAFDDMDIAATTEDMAEAFAARAKDAVVKGHVLGLVDDRLLPAVRQYIEAYNLKFEEAYEVV